MRGKLVAGVVAFFIIVSVVIALAEAGPAVFTGTAGSASSAVSDDQTNTLQTAIPNNPIAKENAQQGTTGWEIPDDLAATSQIQAYAGATSVAPGQSITFYVSTQNSGTTYRLDIYRMGWYAGLGARLITTITGLVGVAQGYYDENTGILHNCPTCTENNDSRDIEANWKPSVTVKADASWVTGVYLAKFTDINGYATYAPFDVLGDPDSTYVAVTADTTYQAYNTWGGWSLYEHETATSGSVSETSAPSARAWEVSFDRPYNYGPDNGDGSSQVLQYEIQAIRWMERNNYDVSYISSVDLDTNPGQLLHHKAYISLGHDEYWTKSMRDGVQNARDHGVGLIFMGADPAYWQMRFAPDDKGVANRNIICYKVQTDNGPADLARDPLYGQDNAVVTSMWRDPVVNRPENALVGIMFSDLTHAQFGFPWTVDPKAGDSSLLKGTGLQPGQSYGCGIVGYEWDNIVGEPGGAPNGQAPKGLHILATSKTVASDPTQPDFGNTSYYYAPSGAMVFASGSIYWAFALDTYREIPDPTCGAKNTAVPGIETLMNNVMAQVIVKHPAGS
jgi:hypothetical protein